MASETNLSELQEHLAGCPLCQAVVRQMHTKCRGGPAPFSFMLTASERARVERAKALLKEAICVLAADDSEAPGELRNLQWMLERVTRAVRHVLELGGLTDSDLKLIGMRDKQRKTTLAPVKSARQNREKKREQVTR